MAGEASNSHLKLAELTSASGALVLGIGLGAYFVSLLNGYEVALIAIGIALHAFGMFDKQRLETSAGAAQPRWAVVLYWICWLLLLVLIVAIAFGFRF
jgi:hypothetical protein